MKYLFPSRSCVDWSLTRSYVQTMDNLTWQQMLRTSVRTSLFWQTEVDYNRYLDFFVNIACIAIYIFYVIKQYFLDPQTARKCVILHVFTLSCLAVLFTTFEITPPWQVFITLVGLSVTVIKTPRKRLPIKDKAILITGKTILNNTYIQKWQLRFVLFRNINPKISTLTGAFIFVCLETNKI